MTTDPYIRWAEESSLQWRREIFLENLAAVPLKVIGFFVSAIVLGVFLGIAFSVAQAVSSFAYGASARQCIPLVDGQREDLLRQ
jgi:hypothetical protein